MSEPRKRSKGRGIDAIFEAADLDLKPGAEDRGSRGEDEDRVRARERMRGEARARRGPGRPRLAQAARDLVQRGFYLEPDQDRMIDEIKVALKGRGFNPDRSAIIRAAVEHFYELDRLEQETRVRRAK